MTTNFGNDSHTITSPLVGPNEEAFHIYKYNWFTCNCPNWYTFCKSNNWFFFVTVLTESVVTGRPCVLYPVFTETYSTGDLDLVVDALVKVFQGSLFKKFTPTSLDYTRLHQYRAKSSRKETVDRYMWTSNILQSYVLDLSTPQECFIC